MRWMLLVCMVVWLYAEEGFVVVANTRFPAETLNEQQIRQIYLKRMRYIDDISLVPVNYVAIDPLRQQFEAALLKMSQKQLSRYWAKEHYMGERPPLVQSSVRSAVAFVRNVDGALVYIPASEAPGDLRVLFRQKELE